MSSPYDPHPPGQQGPGYPPQQGPYGPGGYPPPGYGYPQPGMSPYGLGDYLRGGPVGFGAAITEAFRNGFNYQGRASRSAYWWFVLFGVIAYVVGVIVIVIAAALIRSAPALGLLLMVVFLLAALGFALVHLSLTVRRLHDTDKSGFFIFLGLIPFVGGLILLVFYLTAGTPGPNRFG